MVVAKSKTTRKPVLKSSVKKSAVKSVSTPPTPHLKDEIQQYFAEFLGTGLLTFVVTMAVGFGDMSLATPLLAGLTLALLVYTLGGVSGANLNPAVTLSLFVTGKLHYKTAIFYILAQLTGAMFAVTTYYSSGFPLPVANLDHAGILFMVEALGTAILAFGVAAVANKKVTDGASGLVVGGSLALGASIAGTLTFGLINPAIAISWGLFTPTYILAPFVGGLVGALAYKLLIWK